MKRVLLVVPDTTLTFAHDEIQAVVNSGLTVRLLNDGVNEDEISDELLRNEYDVLWFATHASMTANGDGLIKLSGDKNLTASALVQLVRGTNLQLVYLNTCSSFGIASAIQEETDITVICTINDVDDGVAYRTGALFARRLAQRNDYRSAFEAAKPGRNRTYVFLTSYKRWQRLNEEVLLLLREMKQEIALIASHLGIQSRVDEQIGHHNNRWIIAATLIGTALIAFSIVFLAFRLAG